MSSYEGKFGVCNSISVEFALFGVWVHKIDMIANVHLTVSRHGKPIYIRECVAQPILKC